MGIKFVKPTDKLIQAIAADMRQEDIDEVWASNHHTPLQALTEGQELSDYSVIVTVDDVPCVMMGLVKRDIVTGTGVPWLLGSNAAMSHKREFLKQSQAVVDEMLSVCPRLFNYVHVKNRSSIRWLKWLGFQFDEAQPYGVEQEMFHRFHLER